MKLLNIKDNSQQKKGTFSHIENLTGKIADKTLEQLEHEGVFVFPEIIRDSEDIITKDQMILQSVNDTYRTSNVMGFLGCGDERLIIESRFCGDGEDYFSSISWTEFWIFRISWILSPMSIKITGCLISYCSCFHIISRRLCGKDYSKSISTADTMTEM